MRKIGKVLLILVVLVALVVGGFFGWRQWQEKRVVATAREAQVVSDKEVTSGVATKLLWGDTHLHTANSIDAFGFGAKLGPEEALRFARGEEVTSTWGIKAKLDRPLDFLVIADHSGGLGATKALYEAPRFLLRDPTLRRWHDTMHEGPEGMQRVTAELIDRVGRNDLPAALTDPERQKETTTSVWTAHGAAVERYNEPGKFTAFMGFEYTLMPGGNNLHRVVMFRDGKSRTDQVLPL